jgi:hypothetical protein
LATKILENGLPRSYYAEEAKMIDPDKITRSLLNNIKTLKKEELDILDLVISVRDDYSCTKMRKILQEELEPIKVSIDQIKKVVGCNGNS